jgi:hypothetical protein
MTWDMGKIASSGKPGALELFRSVMLASASIPGAFPPVMMEVEARGERYDEMHVDGGRCHCCCSASQRSTTDGSLSGVSSATLGTWLSHARA